MLWVKYLLSLIVIFFFNLCSIGSLGINGEYDTVEGVYVRNCNFTGTQNGARIKTWQVIGYTVFVSLNCIGVSKTKITIFFSHHHK